MFCNRVDTIQWRMVVTATGCAVFVTSHCDVKFTFQIQRFDEVFDTMHIIIHALSLFIVV